MRQTIIYAAAFMLALTAAASADTARDYRELDDDNYVVQPFNVTVDQLDDMNVYGADGREIGEVEEVLVDASGNVVAVSVEADRSLGIGDREVIMRLDSLTYAEGRLSTTLSDDEIRSLPVWDD
jgi:hypothetical protein